MEVCAARLAASSGGSRPRGNDHCAYTKLVTRNAGGPIYFETQNGLMRVAYPRFNGHNVDPGPETNHRAALARLMTEGDQPQLAAAFVNRLWSHFFGEGFTPAVDDIEPHSPASHPELLALFTRQFVRSGYDTKQLVRWICNSEPYQFSSRVGDANRTDEPVEGRSPQFSHMYVKSMTAKQMYDSFLVATRANRAGRVDWTRAESQRQQWLSQFVVNYEANENDEAMSFDGTMTQALTMMNGPLVEKALELSPARCSTRSCGERPTRRRRFANSASPRCRVSPARTNSRPCASWCGTTPPAAAPKRRPLGRERRRLRGSLYGRYSTRTSSPLSIERPPVPHRFTGQASAFVGRIPFFEG